MTLIVYVLTALQFVLPTGASLSSPHYTPNVSLSLSFFILVDGNPILLVAQANMLTSPFTLPFHTSHTIGKEILLTRPFKYNQTPVTSHHLHCHHLSLSGHHLLPGLSGTFPMAPFFYPCILLCVFSMDPELSFKNPTQVISFLCSELSRGSPFHS